MIFFSFQFSCRDKSSGNRNSPSRSRRSMEPNSWQRTPLRCPTTRGTHERRSTSWPRCSFSEHLGSMDPAIIYEAADRLLHEHHKTLCFHSTPGSWPRAQVCRVDFSCTLRLVVNLLSHVHFSALTWSFVNLEGTESMDITLHPGQKPSFTNELIFMEPWWSRRQELC